MGLCPIFVIAAWLAGCGSEDIRTNLSVAALDEGAFVLGRNPGELRIYRSGAGWTRVNSVGRGVGPMAYDRVFNRLAVVVATDATYTRMRMLDGSGAWGEWLSPTGVVDGAPAWSRDGTSLYFVRAAKIQGPVPAGLSASDFSLYRLDIASRRISKLGGRYLSVSGLAVRDDVVAVTANLYDSDKPRLLRYRIEPDRIRLIQSTVSGASNVRFSKEGELLGVDDPKKPYEYQISRVGRNGSTAVTSWGSYIDDFDLDPSGHLVIVDSPWRDERFRVSHAAANGAGLKTLFLGKRGGER